jgi:hypothetical protein
MLTFKLLGKYGRLGNQMFQYSFLYNAGKKTGFDIGFDFKNNPEIAKTFKLEANNSDKIIQKNYAIEKNDFGFFDSTTVPDGTDFIGYFQNSKYILEYQDDLKKIFTFDDKLMEKCYNFMKDLRNKIEKPLVSIHVRRGDYLLLQDSFVVPDLNYFNECIDQLGRNNNHYVIFTDDKKWCFEQFKHIPNIIMNNDTVTDLCLMSLCDHNIISNSSFSWWGSWLNENLDKKIFAPRKWFTEKGPKNWQQIYRQEMVLL